MKKIIFVILLAISTLGLISCSSDGAPDGMQLVDGGSAEGFYFYAPEEWTVSNLGDISAVFVSNLDTTSVTFAKVDTADFKKADATVSDEEYFFNSYFEDMKKEFPSDAEFTLLGEQCVFGKGEESADKAKKYTYNYTYSEHKFGFMQILIKHGDNFYIFTYSALLENRNDDTTYYDYYLEKLQSIIDNFRFTAKGADENQSSEYDRDADGYIMVSEKKLCGFELYVPDSYKVDYSSAIVSVTAPDGTNINLTEATKTGLYAKDYWKERKDELSAVVTNLTVISEDVETKLGNNSRWAFAYEYTYEYNGERFHVYQINAVDGSVFSAKGYCFTFTAKEENYESHKDELKKIIEKVRF